MNILDQLFGFIAWKDSHCYYLGCNVSLAKVLKLPNTQAIRGLHDSDLIDASKESLEFHAHNDQAVLAGSALHYIHRASYPYDSAFYTMLKKPLLDKYGSIIGIIYQCIPYYPNNLSKLILEDVQRFSKTIAPTFYKMTTNENFFSLSKREIECLFYILRGQTARQIAAMLNLSVRTIEFYTANLKEKLQVESKAELINKAIQYNYLNYLPEFN